MRNLGLLDFEARRPREALQWFDKTVALDPTSAETYCDMGTAQLELGDQDAALREYTRALRVDPDNKLALANHVYLRTKRCDWSDLEVERAALFRVSTVSLFTSRADGMRGPVSTHVWLLLLMLP